MPTYYNLPEHLQTISADDLKLADEKTQIEIMRDWFFQHFQDPVHECPYDGSEGGYQYIYGGPYDASQELYSEFSDYIDEEVISKLADELDGECTEWSGIPGPEYYDDYLLDFVGTPEDSFKSFSEAIENLKEMLKIELKQVQKQFFFKMIYVNIITVLETYLSEFFIGQLERNEYSFRKFVENNPDFKKEKISLSDIFKKQESLEEYVKKYLVDFTWHNLPKLRPMFKTTLDIDFPNSIGNLIKATHIRHDLVHRAGKTKDGTPINLSKQDISDLIEEVFKFCEHIEKSDILDSEF
jgi:hypothetical protein